MGVGVWFFFFFNDTATTEIYTLSLHDALPISQVPNGCGGSLLYPTGGKTSSPLILLTYAVNITQRQI